ncbi:hypothetical protein D3C72_2011720 [compost metagenome]
MVLENSVCLGVRFWSLFSARSLARIMMLLSGVRSSWDMLARNSDLYLETWASCLAFSSRDTLASSTSLFLTSSWLALSSRLLVWPSSMALDRVSSWSSSSVRMVAEMVFITTPRRSMS